MTLALVVQVKNIKIVVEKLDNITIYKNLIHYV